ncbi:PQQ-dependent sugar dehydrogenase [Dyadobacter arcticus]|uniref:Glucose/arabinose dehydrogenase n=1 Tax=Dyadobacter arcticus TaxID=1078754 RepID=A0ABX0ULG8_9BACT|nr:PQQ-dependent sugar dehydrogenase [Dyadobacter arcticus]NIJ53852.1 glucose/arabinose dehydrogenase [Dyadobacter arcticus]
MKKIYALLCLMLIVEAGFLMAQPVPVIEMFVSGFTRPVRVVHAYDARLFVAEIGGRIKVVKNGAVLPQPFLDISSKINDPVYAGIYSIAFAPDYQISGYLYVLYVLKSSSEVQLSRFSRSASNPDLADAASELKILTIPYEDVLGGHRGGDLAFGKDGFLYVSTGDNGPGSRGDIGDPKNNSQNMTKIFGKMLKLNVNSPAPAENILTKIFALGLRNPWRFSFDRSTGDLWIGDNGQDAWEEVNYLTYPFAPTISNFGWNCLEANQTYNTSHCATGTTYTAPKYTYPGFNNNGGNSASVMGGYVYRGSKYPSMKGYYFFGDYQSGKIGLLSPAGTASFPANLTQPSLISFGEDQSGELYALSLSNGTLSKIVYPDDPLPVTLAYLTQKLHGCNMQLEWKTSFESNFKQFDLQRSKDGKKFESITTIQASGTEKVYYYEDVQPYFNTNYYRLKMIDQDGSFQYSKLVRGTLNCPDNKITVFPNPSSKLFTVSGLKSGYHIEVYNSAGRILLSRKAFSEAAMQLDLKNFMDGIYILKVSDAGTGYYESKKMVKK